MAFSLNGINRVSAGANTNAPALMAYYTATDTGAQVAAASYFDDFVENLRVGTIILVRASDGIGFYSVTAVSPAVTTSALATIGVGGVGAAQIQAGAIETPAFAANAVDSAAMDPQLLKYVKVSITAAEWNGMYAAPKLLVAAGGANKLHVVNRAMLEVDYGGAQFAAGGNFAIQYDNTANGAGILASAAVAAAVATGWAADNIAFMAGAGTGLATAVNKGLYMSNITAAFTTGTSVVDVHLWYSTVTTTL